MEAKFMSEPEVLKLVERVLVEHDKKVAARFADVDSKLAENTSVTNKVMVRLASWYGNGSGVPGAAERMMDEQRRQSEEQKAVRERLDREAVKTSEWQAKIVDSLQAIQLQQAEATGQETGAARVRGRIDGIWLMIGGGVLATAGLLLVELVKHAMHVP